MATITSVTNQKSFGVQIIGIEELVKLAISNDKKMHVIGRMEMPLDCIVAAVDVRLFPTNYEGLFSGNGYKIGADVIPQKGVRLDNLALAQHGRFEGFDVQIDPRKPSRPEWLSCAALGSTYPIYLRVQDVSNFTGIYVWHVVHSTDQLGGRAYVKNDLAAFARATEQVVNAVCLAAGQQPPGVTLELRQSGIIDETVHPKAVTVDPNHQRILLLVRSLYGGE